jgi:putative colanic acid biosynthesis UDP-glucose lipid carrier transferase
MLDIVKNKSLPPTNGGTKLIGGEVRSSYSEIAMFSRIVDAVVIGLSLWMANIVYGHDMSDGQILLAVCSIGIFFFFSQVYGLYRSWRGASVRQETARLWFAWIGVILVLLLFAYMTKTSDEYSRLVTMSWFGIAPVLLTLWRMVLQIMLGYMRERGINVRNVAIVGAREVGADVARTILESPWMGLRPIGFFDDRKPAGSRPLVNDPVQVIGNLDTLVDRAREGNIDLVYITLPLRAEERIRQLLTKLSDTTASVYVVPDVFVSDLMSASWSNIGDLPAVRVFETPFYGVDGWLKRLEDFVCACMILTLIAIPMAFIALGVKLSSPGPVLFKQRRYGLRGNSIDVWKFRTMKVCEDGDDVQQAKQFDNRVTPFGALLRKTSLDELPQFINVLQGSMSIVGPRPHAVVHNEQYRKLINGYMLRHKVKPGITGLAQVSGWRGETDTLDKMQHRVEYDLAYIRNWSLWLDIKIIFLTMRSGFTGKNAY